MIIITDGVADLFSNICHRIGLPMTWDSHVEEKGTEVLQPSPDSSSSWLCLRDQPALSRQRGESSDSSLTFSLEQRISDPGQEGRLVRWWLKYEVTVACAFSHSLLAFRGG